MLQDCVTYGGSRASCLWFVCGKQEVQRIQFYSGSGTVKEQANRTEQQSQGNTTDDSTKTIIRIVSSGYNKNNSGHSGRRVRIIL